MLTGRAHPLPVVMLAFSIALGMSGCVAPTPDPTPITSAAPSPSPLFDSDEEALAAATAAYAAYLAAADAVTAAGARDVTPLAPFLTPAYFESQLAGYQEFAAKGLRTTGATTFQPPKVQSVVTTDDGNAEVLIYLCVDVSAVLVVDVAGSNVTPPDRTDQYPLLVTLRGADRSTTLRVQNSETWTGANFCA